MAGKLRSRAEARVLSLQRHPDLHLTVAAARVEPRVVALEIRRVRELCADFGSHLFQIVAHVLRMAAMWP
jgi:hypothetical protein